MKTLLLIPSTVKTGIEEAVRNDCHPAMDYLALASALGQEAAGSEDSGATQVELLDYAAVDRAREPLLRLVRRIAGRDAALALLGFLHGRRGGCDAVFTNGENVAIPLALLLRVGGWCGMRRPGHVTIGHRLSTGKKRLFLRTLGLHREMDTIFVYAATQEAWGRDHIGIPPDKLRRIAFHADHRFYRPIPEPDSEAAGDLVCSAGLEWRDYPTLIAAACRLPHVHFRLAAASPWSKHTNEVADRTLPPNVAARRYPYGELRDLYARAAVVAVPLYENDFQAGVTTILEAMAMGKPVVVTRTVGQTDVIVDGENGVTVPPGDPGAWEAALRRLLQDAAERQRLGEEARLWVERHATLDAWVATVVAALRASCIRKAALSAAVGAAAAAGTPGTYPAVGASGTGGGL